MSYRRKKDDATVEAVQRLETAPLGQWLFTSMPDWMIAAFEAQNLYYAPKHVGGHLMLNGETEVPPGDWIVQQPDGSLVAVKAKVFAKGYEAV